MDTERKATIIKANRLLQAKVGTGEVDSRKVEKSQTVIDDSSVDFAPMATEYLESLDAAIAQARQGLKDGMENHAPLISAMTAPVMQIKANAGMFGYDLIGDLSNVMMNFLETIQTIDKNVLEIIEANRKTLNLILVNRMKGDGGEYGRELTTELREACKRYFAKMASMGKPIEAIDAFFVDG